MEVEKRPLRVRVRVRSASGLVCSCVALGNGCLGSGGHGRSIPVQRGVYISLHVMLWQRPSYIFYAQGWGWGWGPRISGLGNPRLWFPLLCFALLRFALRLLFIHGSGRITPRHTHHLHPHHSWAKWLHPHIFPSGPGGRRLYNITRILKFVLFPDFEKRDIAKEREARGRKQLPPNLLSSSSNMIFVLVSASDYRFGYGAKSGGCCCHYCCLSSTLDTAH